MTQRGLEITIYEDDSSRDLFPLTCLRPSFLVLSGAHTLVGRLRRLAPQAHLSLVSRRDFTETLKLEFPGLAVNDPEPRKGLFVNGRCLWLPQSVLESSARRAFLWKGSVVAFYTDEEVSLAAADGRAGKIVSRIVEKIPREEISVQFLERPWDLIRLNRHMLGADLGSLSGSGIRGVVDALSVVQGDAALFSIGAGSRVEPFSVVDLRDGPVVIGEGAVISSHSTIQGPAYIGDGAVVEAALVRGGTSIGPACRISGEVEESVFQGWSNKHHLGFVGHSWVGEWANLGAGTNTSDLKNNYSSVRVGTDDLEVDTGMQKLGCFIGDHTKTGIGTLLNTGAAIGPFCNLVGGGVSPKYLPPFSWQGPGGFEKYRLDEALSTAKAVMRRRSREMSESYEKLVRGLYDSSGTRKK